MDFDFSHIAPVKTAKLSLGTVVRWPATNPSPVVLEVRYAGDGNPEFMSARAKTPLAKDRISGFERVARLYARHVIVGWDNVGIPVEPFSPDRCEALLLALIRAHRTGVIDYISAFCTTEENFHDPIQSATDLGNG